MITENPDLQRWLKQVTKGLPRDVVGFVADEIRAHYEDALADHIAQGQTPQQAHRSAMLELGDAEPTAEGFQQIHLADKRYMKMALYGIGYTLTYLVSLPIHTRLGGGHGFNPVIFLFVIYICQCLKTIASDRFNTRRLDFYDRLIIRAIVVVCVTRLLGWAIYHHPTITESYTRGLWNMASQMEMVLNLVSLSALLVVAASLLVLGEQAFRMRDSFYRLFKPLCALVAASGLGLAVFGVASTYAMINISAWGVLFTVSAAAIACCVLVFIFFRAGYRREVYTA